MNTSNEAAVAADVKYAFDMKVRAGIVAPVARHLREDLLEDRLAEGVAMSFEQYTRSVAEGRPMGDAMLVHACRLRAIDLGRRVAGAQGARPKSDVYDERHYKEGRVDLLRLDGLFDDGDEEQALVGWAEALANNPARKLASAIDLERWLASLAAEDRLLLALRQAGHTLGEISLVTGRSMTFACARLRELGKELAARMGVKLGLSRAA